MTPSLQNQGGKVTLDNGVLHALHGDGEQIGVGGVREVNIDFAVLGPVETTKLVGKIFGRRIVIFVAPRVVREIVTNGLFREFFLEKINLVQEEDYRRPLEPGEAHNGFKQDQSFLHLILRANMRQIPDRVPTLSPRTKITYRCFVFDQALIVPT